MRIFIKMLTIISTIFFLSGCSLSVKSRINGNERKVAEEQFQKIIVSLENKDNSAIKSMFSKEAREKAIDLDKGIDYIIKYYKGDLISSDLAIASEENQEIGKVKTTINAYYTIQTNIDTYKLNFTIVNNTSDAKENGLYSMYIIKQSDDAKQTYYVNRSGIYPGALCPEMLESEDYLSSIVRIVESQDDERLKGLFSKNSIDNSLNLDYNIETLMSLFQGHMTSFKDCLPPNEIPKEQLGNNTVIKGYYEVTTESNTYLVYFIYKRNETDPNEDGLYTLQVVKKIDMNTQFSTKDCAGIYCS